LKGLTGFADISITTTMINT